MRILFVCTGNTCRSYMAESLMKELLDDPPADDRLPKEDIKISSAGLFAVEGDEANEEAEKALKKLYGIENEKHKARQLTEEMAEESDLIFTMEESQKHAILDCYPDAEGKVFSLKEFALGQQGEDDEEDIDDPLGGNKIDVDDPYGGDLENYMECAQEIMELLKLSLKKLVRFEKRAQD